VKTNQAEIAPSKLIATLRGHNLLPAIVFLPTRRRCDESAMEVSLANKAAKIPNVKEEKRAEILDEFTADFPEIAHHKHRRMIVRGGVAAHHAGHIPAWKLLIEKLMSAGLLDAIFATSTVAAGVDFPARTVVITNADTRGNDGWRPLQASELQQMTGRAGRRGKDKVGFVVAAPGRFQNPGRIAYLLRTQPDPLESRFRATYTSLVNLLDAFKSFDRVREIAEKSFAFRDTARQIAKLRDEAGEKEKQISDILKASGFDLTVENAVALERLSGARARLQEKLPVTRGEIRHRWLEQVVEKGRIVSQGKSGKRFFLVLQVNGEKISAMRDDGVGATLTLGRLNRVYAKKYPIKEDSFDLALDEIDEKKNPPLQEPRMPKDRDEESGAVEILNAAMEKLAPDDLGDEDKKLALDSLWQAWEPAEVVQRIARDIDNLAEEIWTPFEQRARVLDHFGYLDFNGEMVTESGKWLADVRVDRPLLVGEALKHELFNDLEPKGMAALMAALAADPDRNYGELEISDNVTTNLGKLMKLIDAVTEVEWENGVEAAPDLNTSAAAAAELWAAGVGEATEWDELVAKTAAEEGDLVRLLSRTGEALLQIAALKNSQPRAAEAARATAAIILREPVR
jgi:ATP-dependent RNA helicase HelY